MDIKEIRRFRLRKLILTKFSGVSARLAEHIGKQPSYIARIFSSNPEHSRNVGEKLAREIEEACGLDSGFLDRPLTRAEVMGVFDNQKDHPELRFDALEESHNAAEYYREQGSPGEYITIHRLGVQELMGPGNSITLETAWIRKNVTFTELDNLWLVSNVGDGMSPTIEDGDLLLVDAGVNSVRFDAIYLFGMNGQFNVKRIQLDLDGMRLISDNPLYSDVIIPMERQDEIKVGARVVYAWSGTAF